jgi:hypothetical protein
VAIESKTILDKLKVAFRATLRTNRAAALRMLRVMADSDSIRAFLRGDEDALYVTDFWRADLVDDAVDVWSALIENHARFVSFDPFFSMARRLIESDCETATKALTVLADYLDAVGCNGHFDEVHNLLYPKLANADDGFVAGVVRCYLKLIENLGDDDRDKILKILPDLVRSLGDLRIVRSVSQSVSDTCALLAAVCTRVGVELLQAAPFPTQPAPPPSTAIQVYSPSTALVIRPRARANAAAAEGEKPEPPKLCLVDFILERFVPLLREAHPHSLDGLIVATALIESDAAREFLPDMVDRLLAEHAGDHLVVSKTAEMMGRIFPFYAANPKKRDQRPRIIRQLLADITDPAVLPESLPAVLDAVTEICYSLDAEPLLQKLIRDSVRQIAADRKGSGKAVLESWLRLYVALFETCDPQGKEEGDFIEKSWIDVLRIMRQLHRFVFGGEEAPSLETAAMATRSVFVIVANLKRRAFVELRQPFVFDFLDRASEHASADIAATAKRLKMVLESH